MQIWIFQYDNVAKANGQPARSSDLINRMSSVNILSQAMIQKK